VGRDFVQEWFAAGKTAAGDTNAAFDGHDDEGGSSVPFSDKLVDCGL